MNRDISNPQFLKWVRETIRQDYERLGVFDAVRIMAPSSRDATIADIYVKRKYVNSFELFVDKDLYKLWDKWCQL